MVPFNAEKLQALMEEAGVDLVLASTRHNIRYLTGGYYFHFHSRFTHARGTQYLPFVGIPRGAVDRAFYVGRRGEGEEMDEKKVWITQRYQSEGSGTQPAAKKAVEVVKSLNLATGRLAIEQSSLPVDAYMTLQKELPHAHFVDATPLLDELRAIKSPGEIERMRTVAERDIEAIGVTLLSGYDGISTQELSQRVEQEISKRGLHFIYSFVCAGPSFYRAPSPYRTWKQGHALHIDAGGSLNDYLTDICRMGYLGTPSSLAQDLLQACRDLEKAVLPVLRPGIKASEVQRTADQFLEKHPLGKYGKFIGHGIGLVHHEPPVINTQAHAPLEAGMVISIEMEFPHPEVGHVKLEDIIAITPEGNEILGNQGHDWYIPQ